MAWRDHIPGFKRRGPVRAGVLNTGELVLVDDTNCAQVFTAPTTDLIRDALAISDGSVFGSIELRPGDATPLPEIPRGGAHAFADHP